MAMQRPIPTPQRPTNPTPLELAIHQYEVACAEYHNAKAKLQSSNLSKVEQKRQQHAQTRDWQHLQLRKRSLAIQAKLQAQLEQYRTESKLSSPKTLENENHHPTLKLTRHLTAVGEPQPSPDHSAHHIIMGKGRYLAHQMAIARFNLHQFGIGINDPFNGVWLVHSRKNSEYWRVESSDAQRPRHWATPESPVHLTLHGKNYEQWISQLFGNFNLPEQSFLALLRHTKLKLRFGGYPSQIEEPYDPTWNGKA